MNQFLRRLLQRTIYRGVGVEVRERDGVRTLHLGSDIVQSAMRLHAPEDLELAYTRSMMAFRLFVPDARNVLLIGLGGGSIAKFIYRRLPQIRLDAVESRAEVVAVARSHFLLPPDDSRFRAHVADGGVFVRGARGRFDAILVDAFDANAQASVVADAAFHRECRAALDPSGVVAVNLWSGAGSFHEHVATIERVFDDRCLCLPAERPGNVIVFGFNQPGEGFAWSRLEAVARSLEAATPLGHPRFVSDLRLMNRYDELLLRFG